MSVQINQWNNEFYNTLQDFNKAAFVHAIYKFSWLAAIFIVLGVYSQYFNQMLQIRWRRWLTRTLSARLAVGPDLLPDAVGRHAIRRQSRSADCRRYQPVHQS